MTDVVHAAPLSASLAWQVTGVTPMENCEPDAGLHVMVTGPLLPVTVGRSNLTTALPLPPFEFTGGITGHEIVIGNNGSTPGAVGVCPGVGAAEASTVTADPQDAVSLLASTAVQVMLVVPTGNIDPDAGEQLAETGAVPPETVGAKVTATGTPVADVAVGAGQRIVGGGTAAYVTTTDVLHDACACRASVAVHVVGVEPTGKSDPDAGEQEAVTGATPPDAIGEKLTATGLPSIDDPIGVGHSMRGAAAEMPAVMPATSSEGVLNLPVESYERTMK